MTWAGMIVHVSILFALFLLYYALGLAPWWYIVGGSIYLGIALGLPAFWGRRRG